MDLSVNIDSLFNGLLPESLFGEDKFRVNAT
jgi:hypothetical protein